MRQDNSYSRQSEIGKFHIQDNQRHKKFVIKIRAIPIQDNLRQDNTYIQDNQRQENLHSRQDRSIHIQENQR